MLKTIFFDIFVVNALILQIVKPFFVFYFYHQVWDYILNMKSSSNSPVMSNVRNTSISTLKSTSCLCVNFSLDFSFFKYMWWTHVKMLKSNQKLTHKHGAGKDVSQALCPVIPTLTLVPAVWNLNLISPSFIVYLTITYMCVCEKKVQVII